MPEAAGRMINACTAGRLQPLVHCRCGVLLGALLLVMAGNGWAGTYLPQGEARLRHDVQLLADHGLLGAPVTTWPLPVNAVAPLRGSTVEGQPAPVRRAYRRVMRRLDAVQAPGVRAEAKLALAEKPVALRTFADTPRGEAAFTFATEASTSRGGFRLAVNGVSSEESDGEAHLDGSHAAFRLGGWLVTAGAQDRWWGPGWEGSLILGNNARPVPAVSIERDAPAVTDLPVIRWLGPWQLTTFLGQLESDREAPRAKLFGMRLTFRPLPGLEIGLSRTAQWGGEGRPRTAKSFGNMLIGRSNYGDTGGSGAAGGDANQLAGYDLRWVSPVGEAPYAVYAQLIGEDEAGAQPYKFIGLAGAEVWGAWGETDYRVHVEVADTTVNFFRDPPDYNVAYEHSGYVDGYRYHGRPLGHAMDGDGQMVSLGLQLVGADGDTWRLLARHTEQNRDGGRRRAGLGAEEATFSGMDVTHGFDWHGNRITLSAGVDRAKAHNGETSTDGRGWLSVRRQF